MPRPKFTRPSNKELPLKGWDVVPVFLFSVFVSVPLAIGCLPVVIASIVWSRMTSTPRRTLPPPPEEKLIQARKPGERREFDIVLYGATGFTGKLAAEYITERYGRQFRWAIAGRRAHALEEIRMELSKTRAEMKDLPILIADGSDSESLMQLASRTSVIITTAGPFQLHGTLLLRACAHKGTGYCDITGEVDWVRQMIALYNDTARKSGARIVNFCGHDCVPWDLLTLQLASSLRAKGEELASIRFFDEVRANPSGGTLESMRTVIERGKVPQPSGSFDPLVLVPSDSSKAAFDTRVANPFLPSYSAEYKSWVGPFIMAGVMANCIKRSNAINQYGKRVVYYEAAAHPGMMSAFVNFMTLTLFGMLLVVPFTRRLLYKHVLPKPGQGPSKSDMALSFLHVTGFATGSKGSTVSAMTYIDDDPAYRDTARMLVEAGLSLALQGDSIPAAGGIFTPASCQGEILIERLKAKGTVFSGAS